MKKIRMFCISLEPNHYKFIKDLGYTPVGLGEKIFDDKKPNEETEAEDIW